MRNAALILLAGIAIFISCDSTTTQPPPVTPIRIANPGTGAVLHDPTVINVQAGANYSFSRVDFYIDSMLVAGDTVSPFEYLWNIFNYPSGRSHLLYVTGYTADSSYISPSISVMVEYTRGLTFVSSYRPSSQQAVGVSSYLSLLFVSLRDAGLEVLDISTIGSPQFRARFDTPGQALHSDNHYPFVFIADRDQGVSRADFYDPDTLIAAGRYTTQSLANDVAVSGNYLYVAENDGLSILNITDADTMRAVSRLVFSNNLLRYVIARHDTAFVVALDKFFIVDCSSPQSPSIMGAFDNLNLARGAAVIDTFVFIANGSGGLLALSIENPSAPRSLATFSANDIINAVAVSDGVVFAGGTSGNIYALDYTVAGQLREVDRFNTNSIVEELNYQWPYLFAAANNNVDILRFVP